MLRFPSLTSLTSAGFDQSSLLGDNFASLLDVSVFDSGGNELKAAPVTKRTELTAEFQRLNILLLRAVTGKMIGTALLTEVKVHSTSKPSNADVQTTVSGSLGGLQIMNLLTGSTLHQKIFSVGRDPVAEDYSRSDH